MQMLVNTIMLFVRAVLSALMAAGFVYSEELPEVIEQLVNALVLALLMAVPFFPQLKAALEKVKEVLQNLKEENDDF